jgi:hypothetical protein
MSDQDGERTPSVANMAATYRQIDLTAFEAKTSVLRTTIIKMDAQITVVIIDKIMVLMDKDRPKVKVSAMLYHTINNILISALPKACRAKVKTSPGEYTISTAYTKYSYVLCKW